MLDGEIGVLHQCIITSRDPGLPSWEYLQGSGGQFRDMTIHDFDMARWILGEEVESVLASGSVMTDTKIHEVRDFDSVNVILRTHSGKQCLISNSRRATYGYEQRIEVLGSKGMDSAGNTHEKNIEISTIKVFKKLNELENFEPGKIRSISFIWLLILTGARKSEIANAQRSWIKDNKIVIPFDQYKTGKKTGKDRIIYLSDNAMKIVNKIIEVYPNEKTITGIKSPEKTWDRIRKECDCPHLRLSLIHI